MRAPFLGRIFSLFLLVAGCGSDAKDPGPPGLVKFLVLLPGEPDLDLLAPPDGGVAAISGAASFKLVFNQLLDGDRIETVSGTTVTPRTDVASIVWTGAPAGAPAITATTSYDPSGASGVTMPAPKILIAVSPGLPSGAQLQVKLDRTKVVGKKGAAFVGSDTQMLATMPFAASTSIMEGQAVAAGDPVQVIFTNVPAMNVGEHIQLTSAGMPVMAQVMADAMDPRKVSVAPATWVPGASYTLTADKDAADLFGIKLAQAVTVMFTIKDPNAEAGAPGDAGAPDDASADGAVPDAAEDSATGG
jgi:hypothetical protein